MVREGRWLDVYPFNGRDLGIFNSGKRAELSSELSDYVESKWSPKAEKGASSWIPLASRITFGDNDIGVDAGAMQYHQIEGINEAINNNLPFAPSQGYVNSLSVGFPTVTKDGKVIFQRRGPDVHCPNVLIHEPCGYMASMNFVERSECANEECVRDPRLFDIKGQLDYRKNEIAGTFGVSPNLVNYESKQDFLGTGWVSTEMYFSTTGRIDVDEKDLTLPEGVEFYFAPASDLRALILNQGRLSVDPNQIPDDSRRIPLIDESLTGLIWGYERLTGQELDIGETVEALRRDGININVYDTSPGKSYEFPTSF